MEKIHRRGDTRRPMQGLALSMLRCRGRGMAMPPPHLDFGESKKTPCRHNFTYDLHSAFHITVPEILSHYLPVVCPRCRMVAIYGLEK